MRSCERTVCLYHQAACHYSAYQGGNQRLGGHPAVQHQWGVRDCACRRDHIIQKVSRREVSASYRPILHMSKRLQ